MNKGKFITFEGADGVGKSTQVKMLQDYLEELGVNAVVTREPGGNDLAEAIRGLLRKATNIDALADTLLLFAARREHFVKVIEPQLNEGNWVVCDRFYDSTLVYQGRLKGVSVQQIMQLKQMAVGNFEPDFTIVLDLDYDRALQHLHERNITPDGYDLMRREEYDVIRSAFRELAKLFSYRSVFINANGSKEIIFSKILKEMKKHNLLENIGTSY